MHNYLRSLGFATTNPSDTEKIINDMIKNPDETYVGISESGYEYKILNKKISEETGVYICGTTDVIKGFKMEHFYPYISLGDISTKEAIELMRSSDKESYQGFCDDYRLGVNLIFFLENMHELIAEKRTSNVFSKENYDGMSLSGLSTEGKIILPVKEDVYEPASLSSNGDSRSSLIEAAKEGDEDAIESLALDEMDKFNMISKRMKEEDIYSIVKTTFLPYGIESDKYYVIGDIAGILERKNEITGEEFNIFEINTNGVTINICINKQDLLGEPQIGYRFKGNLWLQGHAYFKS